jgi:hypothetical protein
MKLRVTILALLVAAPAMAAPLQPWIGASGSYNTYAMNAINQDIADFNQTFAPLSMDEIDSGIGFGVSAGADVDRWSFSVGYDRLPASTSLEGAGNPSYDLAANTFLGRAAYRLPLNAKFGVLVGLGAGIASASGGIGQNAGAAFARIGPSTNAVIYESGLEASGSTFCYEGFVEGDVPLGGNFSLVPSLGYRGAKIEADFTAPEGSMTKTIDFSGMAARVGLRFAL